MKIGVFNRAWNISGGGENYVGSIAQFLAREHQVELISIMPTDWRMIEKKLNLNLSACSKKIWPNTTDSSLAPLTSDYDLFINGAHRSEINPHSSRSILVCYFPHSLEVDGARDIDKFLLSSSGQTHFFKRPIVNGVLSNYSAIFTISPFSKGWIDRRWGLDSIELMPSIDDLYYGDNTSLKRNKSILSVGRFFPGGHNKKHSTMIENFISLRQDFSLSGDWEFTLAGGLREDAIVHMDYFKGLCKRASGYPVKLKPNILFDELFDLYKKSLVYWHASGWGENAEIHPERFEHFGITTCEASAAGCIPVLFDSPAQRDIVESLGVGFLYSNYSELKKIMMHLNSMEEEKLIQLSTSIRGASHIFSRQKFEYWLHHAINTICMFY